VAKEYQKNWLDKLVTHNRDTVGDFGSRVVLHIPIGLIIGLTSIIPLVGYTLARLFVAYEQNEDFRTADHAWKDYYGALVGFVIAVPIVLAGVIWLILFLLNWHGG